MNKKVCAVALGLIIVTIFLTQVLAMEKRPAPKKINTVKITPTISKATGKVTGYNWSSSTITISVGGGISLTVVSDDKTSISKGKKYIKLSEIRSGDIVTINYEIRNGQKIARSILVQEKSVNTNKSKR